MFQEIDAFVSHHENRIAVNPPIDLAIAQK
jgi:hypothetical protein